LPQSVISEQTTRIPENLAKQGISGQNKEKQNYDKSAFRMPRQYYDISSNVLILLDKIECETLFCTEFTPFKIESGNLPGTLT
jgi:hypothetical protein